LAQRKRIMGRLRSLEQIRRVATTIRPLVDRAAAGPAVQADLRALAASAGMAPDQYREYFKGKQEADLLLESGGDPNARSVSDAIGVAQFMVGTGQRCGLRVNLAASNALSRQITTLEHQMTALEALPDTWSRAAPAGFQNSAAADGGVWNRDRWLAYRKGQWKALVMKRRRVDERFDPVKAITAQTRYLLRLTRRYGGIDWALQAYHGGEAGASRTMRLFGAGGRRVSFTELYRRVSPTATPAAFSYLFGRSDDHRYYWWKVLMAERALDLYRRDPAEFERQWRALQPGLSADAAYYPEPAPLQFADAAALQEAYSSGVLVPLPSSAGSLGLQTANLAVLEPGRGTLHKGLRPEAMGALLRLAQHYASFGGREPLTLLSMVQSADYRHMWLARYPPKPLPPNVPRDPEFHTTGLTFDVKTPADNWDRKVLEYALGRLYDTLRISWRKEDDGGSRRYHVVVNPEYTAEMVEYLQRAGR
ncbi:MAG TPA: hypothetical protein VK689_15870, partial [Armatimonadota bacterium]|nr:hypothetical protein [Armatimonadota bacterium]